MNVFGGYWNWRGMLGQVFACGFVDGLGVDVMVDTDTRVGLLGDVERTHRAANDDR